MNDRQVSATAIDTPQALARELARRARQLRARALEVRLREGGAGPLSRLHAALGQALAPMTDEQFADAYAQTITYGLWSARWLSRDRRERFGRARVIELQPATSPFLRELLAWCIRDDLDDRLSGLLDDITDLLARTPVREVFGDRQDPSIHFYQDFLDVYDPKIRRERGVYFTPDEVVVHMVGAIHQILQTHMGLRLGLADPTTWEHFAGCAPAGVAPAEHVVTILDPATGTGTFLLHTLRLIFATMREEYARLGLDDARAARAWNAYVRKDMLPRLHGFERMMAPHVVTHLRLGLALAEGLAAEAGLDVDRWGFRFEPGDRLRVFLTNTLELDPSPPDGHAGEFMAEEARQADRLKQGGSFLVVLGNPPYDRVAAGADDSLNWFLGGKVPGRDGDRSLFGDILDVARAHTIFSHHASLYNLYVYFWRWALWRVFERRRDAPGIVSFVSASSWLTGPGFVGLRKLAREHADAIWTVDLGGDNKSTRPEPNVFDIETPVAITTIARLGPTTATGSAVAYYRKVSGESRAEKLAALATGEWAEAPAGPMDPLVPHGGGAEWRDMPALADLFPWQAPGCKYGRLWPIAPHPDLLARRWAAFTRASAEERPDLFVTATTGRTITTSVAGMTRLIDVAPDTPSEPIVRYGHRSFDRQWALADPRVAALERPALWASASPRQLFLAALMTNPMAAGPALTVSADVPDLHYFCGRGGKDILPLYRDAAATEANVTRGLLEAIARHTGAIRPTPEDLAAYVYALLSAPRYQQRFAAALGTPGPRVPMTRDRDLWREAAALGERLLWLHTYAERYTTAERGGAIPDVPGLAWHRPVRRIPARPGEIAYDAATQSLAVGDGVVTGVRAEVWTFAVSGMPVVKKWLGYRTADGAGKAARSSNALDRIRMKTWPQEWSDELLDLLRVLTLTVDLHPRQAGLLDRICGGPLIPAADLPAPAPEEREEPRVARSERRVR